MSDENKPDIPATKEDLVDAALNFGTNLLTTLDLPASVVKNAYKALGQLSSAAIEWPVAYFEGKAAETRAETEARLKIIRTDADQIARQLEVNPEYVRRAGNKFAEKIIREQINLDEISAIAVNELKKVESDSSVNQGTSESDKEEPANSSDQDVNNNEETTINEDWLNNFETEARQKSTEDMQLRFGRILAGEIRQPGSYSIKSIKLLGELDQNIASLFKKFCSVCVVFGIFGIPNSEHIIDARAPSLGGNAASNALKKYGLGFGQLNLLNEYDLIISDYNSWRDYNLCMVNKDNPALLPFQYQGKFWALLPSLVLCQSSVEGYSFLSLILASSVVNRQWTVARC